MGRLAAYISAMPLLVGWIAPAPAGAEPLNLADPTPRAIQVEFEVSIPPSTVGQTFSLPFEGSYSASGNTGTVVVSAAEYESAIEDPGLDYFGALVTATLIGGSASDFVLDIDLSTGEATLQPLSYQVSIQEPVQQNGSVSRDLSTTAVAGFGTHPSFPGFPFFCTTCVLVPGAPYDPNTGKINTVGSDRLVAPDIDQLSFSRAGDLRLSESPAVPALSIFGLALLALALASLAVPGLRDGALAR
jgi:hypothetical protein